MGANVSGHIVYIGRKTAPLKMKRDFLQSHRMSVWAQACLFHSHFTYAGGVSEP